MPNGCCQKRLTATRAVSGWDGRQQPLHNAQPILGASAGNFAEEGGDGPRDLLSRLVVFTALQDVCRFGIPQLAEHVRCRHLLVQFGQLPLRVRQLFLERLQRGLRAGVDVLDEIVAKLLPLLVAPLIRSSFTISSIGWGSPAAAAARCARTQAASDENGSPVCGLAVTAPALSQYTVPSNWVNAHPVMTVPGWMPTCAASTSSRTHCPELGQLPHGATFGGTVRAPIDQVLPPVGPVLPLSGVPLQHDLLGGIVRVEVDVGEQLVILADPQAGGRLLEKVLAASLRRTG